ncbi:hypothetical protein ACK3SF_00795 [Candidatus Nanosalina sp. VS9-1]|uniref:hypothetical protein n=1 Tax=Candidatus Nanosalina sp. VS9-1 TaxID=3388566 RepID=UPI0039DF7589
MIEDLSEIAVDRAEQLMYGAAGFGMGFSSTYIEKNRAQKAGREPFPEGPDKEWYETVLEDDPMYDDDMHDDNFLEKAYFENFDTIKRNYDELKAAAIMTLIADGVETFLIDGEFFGVDQYPEAGAGLYLGIKTGKKLPTPKDISEMYRGLVSDS